MNNPFARHESVGEVSDLAHRGLHLVRVISNKLADFERQSVSAADVVLNRCAAKLAELPVADLDEYTQKLERYIAKHGSSAVRAFHEDHELSDVLQQLQSTQTDLQKYRPHIPTK